MKMNSWRKLIAGTAILIATSFGVAVQGQNYINGSINFFGGATMNGSLATATEFTSFSGPFSGEPGVLPGAQGDYASIPIYTPVTFSPFSFNPPDSNFELWTITAGSTTYDFQATSVQVQNQNASFLNIQGTGIASITGFNNTPGTWTITDTGGGAAMFTFGASTTVNGVPEPSAFAMVLSFASVVWGASRVGARSKG